MLQKEIITALSRHEAAKKEVLDGIRAGTEKLREKYSCCEIQSLMYLSPVKFLEKGEILNAKGKPYKFPSDQKLFGKDLRFRWLDHSFLKRNKSGEYRFYHFLNMDRVVILDIMQQLELPDYRR